MPLVAAGKEIHYYDVPCDLTVDQQRIEELALPPNDTAFLYIHYFGVYVQQNIDLMNALQAKGYYIIDDRSSTLPVSTYIERADATAYSFYKSVGVGCGGEMRTKTEVHADERDMDAFNRELMRSMNRNFQFYANPLFVKLPAPCYRLANRLLSQFVEFDHLKPRALSEHLFRLPHALSEQLQRIDFDKVTKRRVEIARMYYQNIDPKLFLPISIESVSKQSLIGFPLLVDNPMKLIKQLLRKGIVAFHQAEKWWWDPAAEHSELYNRNVLLPMGHQMTDIDVRHIIQSVNKVILPSAF